ncbi:DUF2631 domain-containing protein [Mycolicibacterium flavescens]|uniref:Transmembrane protein n=1 Tax=Mycolicibacterium flavescens TaxID=1776 RepID=A0A1E3RQT6_MYCFV|nr:DUF2631 domain-containing protein [Mycolicibacterium flavescens]MCV7279561.1 DUF2631 domain-containing protein [Mycolicibacterium flavescens]ODQ92219.1 hypothetical protein BHQ18_00270 [Mycolicibacterium flavescens]
MANTEVQRHTGVDVEEVPSAEWGWSYVNPRVFHIGGLLGAAFLLFMIHGNHTGRVEDLFLIGFAAIIVAFVARDWWLRRRGWIR